MVAKSGFLRERLKKLHDEDRLSWREIAKMDEFKDIPAGSLCSYAAGWEPRTEKARRQFGLDSLELIPQVRDELGRFAKQ